LAALSLQKEDKRASIFFALVRAEKGNNMNWIDILLVLVVVLATWGGWRKGFILGILDLLALGISLIGTFLLYPFLAQFINRYIYSEGVWTLPISFIITYFLLRMLMGLIINRVLRDIPAESHYRGTNRFLGMLPGMVNGLIYATILSALLLAIPIGDKISDETRSSKLVTRITVPANWLEEKLSPVFDKAVERTMNRLTVKPGTEEFVELPFTVNKVEPRADLEKQMLSLVNQERIKAGLNPLKADPELTQVARRHSRDMFARGYFSHVAPEGKGPFDRMRESGVKFSHAGENLALAQTLDLAHSGLMNSPGHRANILRPQFGRLGVGILDGGMYGLMISQEFRN
jgi:uncharacterized protein YkwD